MTPPGNSDRTSGRAETPPVSSLTSRLMLGLGLALFLVVIALLIAPSLVSTDIPTYRPSPPGGWAPEDQPAVDTVTVDASDENAWVFVGFEGRTLGSDATVDWDLAFQRFRVLARGGVADLGRVPFATVDSAPTDGYVETTVSADTVDAALERWYRYGMMSHLLESKQHVYVVHTRDDRYVKLQLLSYYCAGPTPGCVTFRYAFVPRAR